MGAVVVAVDAGTTGVRALAVDEEARVVAHSYEELAQHFPRPGWVEHDPGEIVALVESTLARVGRELDERGDRVAAIGLTNQRETAVAWDRRSGRPLGRAIVWQDRRTADRCREIEDAGALPLVRSETGLVLDSYFSATKWEWMLGPGGVEADDDLLLGTVDDWVCFSLTGRHVTDHTNASRTLCYSLRERSWSDELCELFGVERRFLADIVPSSGRLGVVGADFAGGRFAGVPVSGVAGDQQAALFGQQCRVPGQAKVTYGTGSFVLMNLGTELPPPADGLLTTVAWQLGERNDPAYALEGAVFSSGAAIQWLRDGLGIVEEASEVEPLARTVSGTDGVHLVPAFTGLGSPWWDPDARGAVTGISKGTGRAVLARAAIESMAFQTRDVIDAMVRNAGVELSVLRADGGASVMGTLLQLQADQCQVPVERRATTEVTALGAAFLAGLAEGMWTLEDLAGLGGTSVCFEPVAPRRMADTAHEAWLAALERARSYGS